MAKDDVIELDGIVTDLLPSSKFKVSVTNLSIPVLCYIGGRLKQHKIRIIMGDAVRLEVSAYDLSKGRITYRL